MGNRFLTVCIHGIFIVLPHSEIRLLAPWTDIPLRHFIMTLSDAVLSCPISAKRPVIKQQRSILDIAGLTWWRTQLPISHTRGPCSAYSTTMSGMQVAVPPRRWCAGGGFTVFYIGIKTCAVSEAFLRTLHHIRTSMTSLHRATPAQSPSRTQRDTITPWHVYELGISSTRGVCELCCYQVHDMILNGDTIKSIACLSIVSLSSP